MNKKNVVVIYGGQSPEHEISKVSAANIIANISDEKYTVIPVYITKEGRWLLYDGSIDNIKNIRWEKLGTPAILSPDAKHAGLIRIVGDKHKLIPIDVAFPVMHGRYGEDGAIQGLLELSGIPYVGCGPMASSVFMDKALSKIIACRLGIPTVKFRTFLFTDEPKEIYKTIRYKIGYPCFIKPARSGSSIGVSIARNKKELEAAVNLAFDFDSKIIAEKAVRGRELECAVIGIHEKIRASNIGEVVSDNEFYDFEAKYIKQAENKIPADIPEHIAETIKSYSIELFKSCDGFGLGRADFFYDEEADEIYFNELNTMPGFTNISMFQKLWALDGLFISEILDLLIETADLRA